MNEIPPRFPVFLSLAGKNVLIVGGGPVAARRSRVLLEFGAVVTVVAPALSQEAQAILPHITWLRASYEKLDRPYTLVVAATNDRCTNRQVGEDAKKAGIPVSVADCAGESTFWFPAIMRGNGLIAGMISENGDHGAVKEFAKRIRRSMEERL